MARYTGPKDKLSRRENFDLFSSGSKLSRLSVPPGQHGPKGVHKISDFARQLREKQKAKRLYGILERQFRNYVERALKVKGNTGEVLISILERRLDNVIYRLGFVPSRPAARQLVSHGHVKVNGRKVNIPSYQVSVGDVIELSPKALKMPVVIKSLEEKDKKLPPWLEKKGAVGEIKALPAREDVYEPISERDIVEFYSR